ncbi:MAG: hypothetical protein KDB10_02165 [Acidimicrobiales bacterium]|nr:hypothetical protein [Acidimicrobiales bacterium]
MRERRSSDWVVDLNGRHGIEAQVEHALAAHPSLTLLKASTTSFDRLDFQVLSATEQLVQVELKAKRQPLSKGWRDLRPEVPPQDLFVLDELALRKIVDAGRYAFLLVRDVPTARWVLWSVGSLLVASRARHSRALDRGSGTHHKGKLLFDLGEACSQTHDLAAALDEIERTARRVDALWTDVAPWPRLGATG